MDQFDVFLSYNSKDKPGVIKIAEELKARGLRVWLDVWELQPGQPWQEALEKVIETVKSAAVLVGNDGLGPWQTPEMRACLSECVNRKLPVIPVLLPGAPKKPRLPLFLKAFTWVDLRKGVSQDKISQLEWGITGLKPEEGVGPEQDHYKSLAYYVWDRKVHANHPLAYDRYKPLVICFGFSVSPGAAVMCQEMTLPNDEQGTGVIGELHILHNSNTPRMCELILQDWKEHRGPVQFYGDVTGGTGGKTRVTGSDWDLIESHFRDKWPRGFRICVGKRNPAERVRLNAVNNRLMNSSGKVHLMVDPDRAPKVAEDFESVCLMENGSGELDKGATPKHSFWTDGLGYYIAERYPITGPWEPIRIGGLS